MANADNFLDHRDSYEFADVEAWFRETIEEIKPDLTVAIARGAIRLLQLAGAISYIPKSEFVSHSALPYLPDSALRGKRVLLVDDSVIFGSTMAKTREYLFSRGSSVFCASFCVDRMSFLGEDHENTGRVTPSKHSSIPVLSRWKFWPNQVRRHHDLLVRSLLCSPEHFNLDFPTYVFRTHAFPEEEVRYICRAISVLKGLSPVEDVSTSVASSFGVHRFSAHISMDLQQLIRGRDILIKPYNKLRFTVVPSRGLIKLTPLVQLAFADDGVPEVQFAEQFLNETWNGFSLPTSSDQHYKKAIFQLLTSVMSLLCGDSLLPGLTSNIGRELGNYNFSLDDTDIIFAVGSENASPLMALHGKISNELVAQLTETERLEESECPVDSDLERRVVELWSNQNWLKPREGETTGEMLGKVFILLRNLTDDRKSRLSNPDASRLDVGFTYESLVSLLSVHCGIDVTKQQISYALDTCVDNGLAVPKVVNQAGYWQRVFYSGENEDSQDTRQLQLALYEAYGEFRKGRRSRSLTPFDFHKLAVTLKDLFPWLPISTRYYTFGRYAMVGQSEEELIDWLTLDEFSPFKMAELDEVDTSTETDDDSLRYKKVLIENPDYKPLVKPTIPIHKTRDLYDAFDYIANAFTKLRQDHKLLVSTCRTQKHAFNAVAFEAHSWAQGRRFNFSHILQAMTISLEGKTIISSAGLDNLYWCTRYISEAYRKHRIFYQDYDKLFKQVEKAFIVQGSAAKRFWKLYMFQGDNYSRRVEDEVESRFRAVMDIVALMRYLTAFIVRLMLTAKLTTEAELKSRFENSLIALGSDKYRWLLESEPEILVLRFNEIINRWRHPGRSFMQFSLPIVPLEEFARLCNGRRNEIVEQCGHCFEQLRRWQSEFCPEYEVSEGGFPYLPTAERRVQADGSMEKLLRDSCILTMDIIGSTNDERSGAMKIAVVGMLDRYRQHNVFSEKTHNDAFVVCADDPRVLWDICHSISNLGEQLRIDAQKMAGTRKGLSKGTVIATTDTSGVCMIRDAWGPHALPKAFYMLKGVDQYAKKYAADANRLVILDDKSKENFVNPLQLEPIGKQYVSGKHFVGTCLIVKLEY